jgi:hypothetical protein
MIRLSQALRAWGTPVFEEVLRKEIEQLDTNLLPLQQGLSSTSHVTDSPRQVMVINVFDVDCYIQVKAGIFYSGIIAGCSCADDPTPVDEQNEYCELRIEINKNTAEATVALLEK